MLHLKYGVFIARNLQKQFSIQNLTFKVSPCSLSKGRSLQHHKSAFLRPFSTNSRTPQIEEAVEWIKAQVKVQDTVADEMVATLTRMGMPETSILSTLKSMGPQGLQALSASVESTVKEQGMEKFTVNIDVPKDNYAFQVQGFSGDNFRTLVDRHTELVDFMECACGGNMACSTCHVIVDSEWYDRTGPPSEEEQDMLDLAYEPTDTSRLGCQIMLSRDLDGLKVSLPDEVNNLF